MTRIIVFDVNFNFVTWKISYFCLFKNYFIYLFISGFFFGGVFDRCFSSLSGSGIQDWFISIKSTSQALWRWLAARVNHLSATFFTFTCAVLKEVLFEESEIYWMDEDSLWPKRKKKTNRLALLLRVSIEQKKMIIRLIPCADHFVELIIIVASPVWAACSTQAEEKRQKESV